MTVKAVNGVVAFQSMAKTWCLEFGINAFILLECRLDLGVTEIGKVLRGHPKVDEAGAPVIDPETGEQEIVPPRLETLRTLFWAGLQEHHPGVDDLEAGRIMSGLGLAKVGPVIGSAFQAAFPEAEGDAGAGPRKPAAKPRR